MSGFAGMVSLDGAPADARLLERMAERLAFRGPDGTHITTKPGAGFCFTFLRTGPAPQCSSQPCSLDGRVWLLGDVRLDGRDDLRRKLEQHGDEFAADVTDEELVLRAWRRWGEDGLPDLIGDYAFALWDTEARKLCCARDLMGARPFFYAQAGNQLYFSNTLDAIRCSPDISSTLDLHFIGDFLLQGSCSDLARSAFRDISRLRPGYALEYSGAGLHTHLFSPLPIEEPLRLTREEEYVEQFRSLFEQAVQERLPRGPAAIFMSGGLDSSAVAAIAVQTARRKGLPLDLRAYTVDCEPVMRDDEGRLAKLVAEHIGIPIELQQGTSCRPYQNWETSRLYMPEPFHEPHRFLYLEQVFDISKHSRVALNGYGGDGIMTGQTWPYLVYLAQGFKLTTIVKKLSTYILKHRSVPPLRGGFRSRIRRALGLNGQAALFPEWLHPHFQERMALSERWQELHRRRDKSHPWYPDAAGSVNGGFWATVLENEDAGWTWTALESRAPLLDTRVHRFLLRVPPLPLCIDKELLRRAVLGYLPDEVRLRRKTLPSGDLLDLQYKNGTWHPLPLPAANETILEFVDWRRLEKSVHNAKYGSLWRDLRPISLLYWLQGQSDRPHGFGR